jgi:spore maturation protein SpmA
MLNWIFLALVVGGTVTAALTGKMDPVTKASADSAKAAVELAIGLIGQMALWLGVMKVLEEAGMMRFVARAMAPIMKRIFPDVPEDHPAMGAMIMNLAANMMGLGNAATPFGLKAMIELNKLNKHPGVATNAMCLFLAINTSGVAVLPLGIVAVRASMGAKDITGIILPSILATSLSTITAIIVCKLIERLHYFAAEKYASAAPADVKEEPIKGIDVAEAIATKMKPIIPWRNYAMLLVIIVLIAAAFREVYTAGSGEMGTAAKNLLSSWLLPTIMVLILLIGFSRGVKVYEALIAGAKEGFNICVTIIPFLVAILVAIGMFRASGALDYMVQGVAPVTNLIGMPPEALPMAFIRPLSGSGALAVVVDTMKTYGPDSFVGFLVCVMNGSMETTFYVLALYFGSVGVRETRHTLIPCLCADLAGIMGALIFSRIFWTAMS